MKPFTCQEKTAPYRSLSITGFKLNNLARVVVNRLRQTLVPCLFQKPGHLQGLPAKLTNSNLETV